MLLVSPQKLVLPFDFAIQRWLAAISVRDYDTGVRNSLTDQRTGSAQALIIRKRLDCIFCNDYVFTRCSWRV